MNKANGTKSLMTKPYYQTASIVCSLSSYFLSSLLNYQVRPLAVLVTSINRDSIK